MNNPDHPNFYTAVSFCLAGEQAIFFPDAPNEYYREPREGDKIFLTASNSLNVPLPGPDNYKYSC